LNALYDNALLLSIVLAIVLILTATFKLFTQVTQAILFKSQFLNQLVHMHEKNDLELWDTFEASKKRILEKNVQGALDESALNSPFRNTKPPESVNEEANEEEVNDQDDDEDDAFEESPDQPTQARHSNGDQRYVNVSDMATTDEKV
jgi:hypothetical protein